MQTLANELRDEIARATPILRALWDDIRNLRAWRTEDDPYDGVAEPRLPGLED